MWINTVPYLSWETTHLMPRVLASYIVYFFVLSKVYVCFVGIVHWMSKTSFWRQFPTTFCPKWSVHHFGRKLVIFWKIIWNLWMIICEKLLILLVLHIVIVTTQKYVCLFIFFLLDPHCVDCITENYVKE